MLEAVSLSPIEFTATTAFLANALEVSPTGMTASHRDTPEILYTIATAQAHNGSAITPTTMTGRHRTRMAILPILVTAPGAIGSLIKCIATELVDYSDGPAPFASIFFNAPTSCEVPILIPGGAETRRQRRRVVELPSQPPVMARQPLYDSRKAAGAGLACGLQSAGQHPEMNRAAPEMIGKSASAQVLCSV
jgi:hypothetical protein